MDFTMHNENVGDLLKQYGITFAGIARQLNVSRQLVIRSLDPEKFKTVGHQYLYSVRRRAEALLVAAGWKGDPGLLWELYDRKLRDAA